MRIKIPFIISVAVLIGAVGGLVMFAYWSVADYDPIAFKEEPIPTFEKEVIVGEPIVIKFDYCKTVGVAEKVESKLVGLDIVFQLPDGQGNAPKGCGTVNAVVLIPNEARPGLYHVEFEATYEVNPVRTVIEKFRTVDFKVIGPNGEYPSAETNTEDAPVQIPIESHTQEKGI